MRPRIPDIALASYVHQLRGKGIPIDTEFERHDGTYKGFHARYRHACNATVTAISFGGQQLTQRPSQRRSELLPAPVRCIVAHGLPEPSARLVASLAFGEG
ncbi:winged helix domain-containing protein [Albidovulum aquaemixtae]